MKRALVWSVLAMAVAFAVCYLFLAPQHSRSPARTSALPESASCASAVKVALPGSNVDAVMAAPAFFAKQVVTNDRQRVFDSPDIFATIKKIAEHGNPDERDWGIEILSTCAAQFVKSPTGAPSASARAQLAAPSHDESGESARKRAGEDLTVRCKGIEGLTREQVAQAKSELASVAQSDATTLRQLSSIENIEDGRWTDAQAKLITDSLYGGDPIVAREASWSLIKVIDGNAPGGNDRQAAALYVLAPIYLNSPLSEFERLDVCASSGKCSPADFQQEAEPDEKPSAYTLRLVEKYKQALAAHADARTIAAIR